jgi:hypothetical protein
MKCTPNGLRRRGCAEGPSSAGVWGEAPELERNWYLENTKFYIFLFNLFTKKGAVACFMIIRNTGQASRPGRPFRAVARTGLLQTTQNVRFGLQVVALRGRAGGLSQH